MLVRMTAEQVQHFWPLVREAIIEAHRAFLSVDEAYLSRCFDMLLGGMMQCWALVVGNDLHILVLTTPIRAIASDQPELLVFAIYALQPMTDRLWLAGYKTLQAYAKEFGCSAITGYADDLEYAMRVVQRFRGKLRAYMRLEV